MMHLPPSIAGHRRLFAGLGLLVILAVIVLVWRPWSGNAASVANERTAVAVRGDVEDLVSALGTLQPLQYVDVGTQVSGQLQKILVDFGAEVKQGDLLAQIDATVYQARVAADEAQLMSLKAQVAEKQANRTLADQQLRRQKTLLAGRATSQDAFESAEANLQVIDAQIDALRAQIQQIESNLKADQANLGYTKIFAPMAGTVVDIIARQGQTLNANQQAPIILRIADLSTMTVVTQVSEADVAKLKLGVAAYFTTLGQPDRRRIGKLRQILPTPQVVNNVVLYSALFDVANPERDLLPQMSAQVFFIIAEAHNVVTVPVAALRAVVTRRDRATAAPPATPPAAGPTTGPTTGPITGPAAPGARPAAPPQTRYTVRVIKDGKTDDRPVVVGVTNRVVAEIVSGLEAGETVVLGAASEPRSGGTPGGGAGRGVGGGPRL